MIRGVAIAAILAALWTSGAGAQENLADMQKYLQFAHNELQGHRNYIERLYTSAGIIAAIVGVALTFFGIKTFEDIRRRADEVYKSELGRLLEKAKTDLEADITAHRAQMQKQVDDLNKLVGDIVTADPKEIAAAEAEANKRIAARAELLRRDDHVSSPMSQMKSHRILWVDDFPRNNDGPAAVLRRAGHSIEQVLDTEAAMRRLAERRYDVVISDMGRGGDPDAGLTLLTAMHDKGITVPVVIYASGEAVERTGVRALDLGAIDVIGNGPQRLLRVLSEIFRAW